MIHIKQITEKDVTKEKVNELVSLLQQLSTSCNESLVVNAIKSSQSCIFVATTDENKIVGTATLGYINCFTGLRVHIEDVVVDSDYRGKGIASNLINEAIERAKILQAKTIDLTSRPERESANRLYQKLGFVKRDTNVYRYTNQIQ
ncbi:putative acetyltransferase [Helicostylum pulchrum]|nr:putative acetyltransferase [Helicostylum pulchrum]